MNRVFERSSWNVPGVRPIPGYTIRCCKCGAQDRVSTVTHSGTMAPEGVSKKFRAKGWLVGTRENRDLCPACVGKGSLSGIIYSQEREHMQANKNGVVHPRAYYHEILKMMLDARKPVSSHDVAEAIKRPEKSVGWVLADMARNGKVIRKQRNSYVHPEFVKVDITLPKSTGNTLGLFKKKAEEPQEQVAAEPDKTQIAISVIDEQKPEPAPAAEPERQPTRDERRIIFAKLDQVYLDETRGYSPGWSDIKTAQDLGVPMKWVSAIREENFGIEQANDEVRETVARIEAALDEAKKERDEYFLQIRDMHAKLSAVGADYNTCVQAATSVEARISAGERELEKLRKLIGA